MKIRPYSAEDVASCRACIVELQEAERLIEPRLRHGDAIADAYIEKIHERCRLYSGRIFVAEIDDDVAGLVVVFARVPYEELDEPPGEYAIVAELVVRIPFRSRGVGAALLQAGEQYARETGASELRIGVLSGNVDARRLYLREGFAPHLETLSKILSA